RGGVSLATIGRQTETGDPGRRSPRPKGRWSIPNRIEATRPEPGIANRVLNVDMPEVILDLANVAVFVGERKASRVPQHVRVYQRQTTLDADPRQHALKSGGAHRRGALVHKNKARAGFLVAQQSAQLTQLVAGNRVRRGATALDAVHAQMRRREINLR